VIASEITSFAPEPYTLKSAMHIKIVGKGSEYIASHHESNIHASGDTPFEAIENLKSLILDTFDLLTSESSANLAIKAKHQRSLLEELIERL
jgi:predicted RNase H-like HicB family nuclease